MNFMGAGLNIRRLHAAKGALAAIARELGTSPQVVDAVTQVLASFGALELWITLDSSVEERTQIRLRAEALTKELNAIMARLNPSEETR